jgi:hypothetical protein
MQISTFLSAYLVLLPLATVATLLWGYFYSKELFILVWLGFFIASALLVPSLTSPILKAIEDGSFLWLGATSGERIQNFLLIERAILGTAQTALNIWFILLLVRLRS